MELKVKIWLEEDGETVFGRGRAQLLDGISRTGSISAAAERMGISYRHAWSMLNASEERCRRRFVERTRGGAGGGGARLTPYGQRVLREFQNVESRLTRLVEEETNALETCLD